MEKELKHMEMAPPQQIETIPFEAIQTPPQPETGFPWGGVGYGVLIVAVIAIATKVLSD